MRYLWCQTENYYSGNWKQAALSLIRRPLKLWDLHSNAQVDQFVGISNHVSARIRNYYQRDAITIYPPVDTQFYCPAEDPHLTRENFYLVVGALEPYKRVDLAIEACLRSQKQLKVIGKGTMNKKLRKKASPNIEFLGWQSDHEIRNYYRRARALLFPGEEDFGIVPLEAQACGCPVIAYGAGGALETLIDNQTGTFFTEQTVQSLQAALEAFETKCWGLHELRENAKRFSRDRFRQNMENYLNTDAHIP
jgi:glycosyltransferase involved in cell wall biosynthesis